MEYGYSIRVTFFTLSDRTMITSMLAYSLHFTNCLTMWSVLLVIPGMLEEGLQSFGIPESYTMHFTHTHTQDDMNGTEYFIH